MPYVAIPSGRIWVARHAGPDSHCPPLLLVHGAAGSHLDWPAHLRRLRGAALYLPDLPGHGRSAPPGRDRVEAYADDMAGLLDALSIERAILGGHSMGGAVALTMALRHPERAAGLLLIGTGARLPINLATSGEDPLFVLGWAAGRMWAEGTPAPALQLTMERLAATDPSVIAADWRACAHYDIQAELGRISAPALIIGGSRDRLTPPELSQMLADGLPRAELRIIDGGGHLVMLEQPEVVRDIVQGWLRTTDFG